MNHVAGASCRCVHHALKMFVPPAPFFEMNGFEGTDSLVSFPSNLKISGARRGSKEVRNRSAAVVVSRVHQPAGASAYHVLFWGSWFRFCASSVRLVVYTLKVFSNKGGRCAEPSGIPKRTKGVDGCHGLPFAWGRGGGMHGVGALWSPGATCIDFPACALVFAMSSKVW